MAGVDREAADLNEARWMRALAQQSLIEKDHLDDHHLMGDFHACVETICADRGLEPVGRRGGVRGLYSSRARKGGGGGS